MAALFRVWYSQCTQADSKVSYIDVQYVEVGVRLRILKFGQFYNYTKVQKLLDREGRERIRTYLQCPQHS